MGELGGIPVVIMQGRFHAYDGYQLWMVGIIYYILTMIEMIFKIAMIATGGHDSNRYSR